jgi:membrane protease YdiL (CAAX protease family)
VLPALLPAFLIGPIEELGWRGVALPLLQRRFAPLWASLIVGVVAAVIPGIRASRTDPAIVLREQ